MSIRKFTFSEKPPYQCTVVSLGHLRGRDCRRFNSDDSPATGGIVDLRWNAEQVTRQTPSELAYGVFLLARPPGQCDVIGEAPNWAQL